MAIYEHSDRFFIVLLWPGAKGSRPTHLPGLKPFCLGCCVFCLGLVSSRAPPTHPLNHRFFVKWTYFRRTDLPILPTEISSRIHFWGLEGPEMTKNGLKQRFSEKSRFSWRSAPVRILSIYRRALGRAQGQFCFILMVTSGAKGPPTHL